MRGGGIYQSIEQGQLLSLCATSQAVRPLTKQLGNTASSQSVSQPVRPSVST